jgi:hypothetical protein
VRSTDCVTLTPVEQLQSICIEACPPINLAVSYETFLENPTEQTHIDTIKPLTFT